MSDLTVVAPAGIAPVVAVAYRKLDGTAQIVDENNPLPGLGGGGGGGAANDRELVTALLRVTTAFTGASVGDIIALIHILDVDATPDDVQTRWRNLTTGANLASPPSWANLALPSGSGSGDASAAHQLTLIAAIGAANAAAWTGTGDATVIALLKKLSADMAAVKVAAEDTTTASPVRLAGQGEYETVAASQNDQTLGASGAAGDYLASLLIIPASKSPGAVSIEDGDGTAITVFPGGTDSVATLHPFSIPLGLFATGAGWRVTTGANVSVIAIGNFT